MSAPGDVGPVGHLFVACQLGEKHDASCIGRCMFSLPGDDACCGLPESAHPTSKSQPQSLPSGQGCMDCRTYGCPLDGPDEARNRKHKHCDCHGPAFASGTPQPKRAPLLNPVALVALLAMSGALTQELRPAGKPPLPKKPKGDSDVE